MELAKNELFFASNSQKFTALAVCFCPSYVRDPKTPRNSGWPTVSGQPLRCLNVIESSHGIVGASWIEGISIEIGD